MLRAFVTAAFLLIAVLVLWMAFFIGAETSTGTLLINLGTEIVGIVMTVAVVEWFFERRRLQTRGRQLAWDSLHAAQNAVWVWQGGPREMETDEIMGILQDLNAAGSTVVMVTHDARQAERTSRTIRLFDGRQVH